MSLIDMYRNNAARKREELARLSQDKARESAKISPLMQKIVGAKQNIHTTKSASTVTSKLNEIARAEKEIGDIHKKIADIDRKIAQKDKELANEERHIHNEEASLARQVEITEKRRIEANKREMQQITSTIAQQSRIQRQMQIAISDLQHIPEKITVLFLASNPIDSPALRLDEEARAIQEKIRLSDHRDSVEFATRWAMRSSDILQAINEVNPCIIHFSGHGTDTYDLVLQNSDGSAKYVSKEAIVQAIATVSDKVRLVFFNTCFSAGQAEEIVNHIEASVGMTVSIGDDAARVFAAQFYSSIGFGHSLDKAFRQAKAALLLEDIPEENTPALFVKNGVDASKIIIVKPAQTILPTNGGFFL